MYYQNKQHSPLSEIQQIQINGTTETIIKTQLIQENWKYFLDLYLDVIPTSFSVGKNIEFSSKLRCIYESDIYEVTPESRIVQIHGGSSKHFIRLQCNLIQKAESLNDDFIFWEFFLPEICLYGEEYAGPRF